MKIEDLTIVDKAYLLKLENYYNNNRFESAEGLDIKDIENLDVVLPSIIKFLQDAWLKLKEERVYEVDHDKGMQVLGGMNILRQLVDALHQEKITELREEYNRQQEILKQQ